MQMKENQAENAVGINLLRTLHELEVFALCDRLTLLAASADDYEPEDALLLARVLRRIELQASSARRALAQQAKDSPPIGGPIPADSDPAEGR